MLDLALSHGWRPAGTTQPDAALERASERDMRWEPAAYFLPRGQTIQGADAGELGRHLHVALGHVQDNEIPLRDGSFGRLHTLESARLAMMGGPVAEDRAETATELLSGSPKRDAVHVAEFLAEARAMQVMPEGCLDTGLAN